MQSGTCERILLPSEDGTTLKNFLLIAKAKIWP
jgi:hypothetical protein